MKRSISTGVFLIFAALINIGGCNFLSDIYDHHTDEAIAVDVSKHIDERKWNDAVLKWQLLSPAAQAKRENQVLLATAYAGRGGLDMLQLSQSIGSMAGNFFTFLLSTFKGATASQYNDQVAAEAILLNISPTAAGRTTDENIFMLFVEFAKLGTLLAYTGDLDADGTVDPTYDNCALAITEGAHVVTAVGNMSDILSVIGTSITGGSLSALTAACGSLGGACSVTLTADVTGPMNQLGRTLVGESNLGVGLAAPYNDPYCQLSAAPIFPGFCPGNTGLVTDLTCP